MARQHLTMRLKGATLKELDGRARELGMTRSSLAERYIEEGLRMERHPAIVFWQRPGGREPMLIGSRLSVRDIVETFRDNEGSIEETADYLAKPVHLIEAVLAYYTAHMQETDALIDEHRRFVEQEEEAWLRRRELPG